MFCVCTHAYTAAACTTRRQVVSGKIGVDHTRKKGVAVKGTGMQEIEQQLYVYICTVTVCMK